MGRGAGEGLEAVGDGSSRAVRHTPRVWAGDARLEAELRAFTDGRTFWPTQREFAAAHRQDLLYAVRSHGGYRLWANRLGLRLTKRQAGVGDYSDEAFEADLRRARSALGRLPNAKALRAAGFPRLATRVEQAGGIERLRRRLDE